MFTESWPCDQLLPKAWRKTEKWMLPTGHTQLQRSSALDATGTVSSLERCPLRLTKTRKMEGQRPRGLFSRGFRVLESQRKWLKNSSYHPLLSDLGKFLPWREWKKMTEEWQGPALGVRLIESQRKRLKNGRSQFLVSDLVRCRSHRKS